ncbi:uncharacterized protein LOC131955439 [Physella acuta]|uniref:uncharacterized protein LOC131955439 n=1 Tax=Physella acuta TaxID=109671 RepID=UPI0027DE36C0|nr:uncharacterized protein LOC131955439 [Physella acuta]
MFLILCLLALNCAAHGTQSKFYVDIDNKTSSFRLLVDSKPWLVSGNTFFSHDGHQYSTADQTLKLLIVASETGEDQVGRWHKTAFDYQGGTLSVKTSIKTYDTPQLPLAIFSQTYIGPATNTSSHDVNSVISSFPSFRTLPSENLGYLSYAGDMVGYKKLSIGR